MSTMIISVVLLILVGLIIRSMLRDKKLHKSSCGSSCCDCGGSCHSSNWKQEYDQHKESLKSIL